jgi:hypothetical protein
MTWEKDSSSLEIRTQGQLPDGRPALDEIVAGGKYFHLNFGVQGGRLWVRLSDQGDENTEWEGDNRTTPISGVDV